MSPYKLEEKLKEKNSIKETQYITSQIETIKALTLQGHLFYMIKNTN